MRHCRAKISFVVFLLFLALEVWNSSFASPLLKAPLLPNLNPQLLEAKKFKISASSSHSPLYHPAIASTQSKTLQNPSLTTEYVALPEFILKEKKETKKESVEKKELKENKKENSEKENVYIPLNELIGEFKLNKKDGLPQINVNVKGKNQEFVIRKVEKSYDITWLYYLLSYYLPEENENGGLTKKDVIQIIWDLKNGNINALIAVQTNGNNYEYGIEGYILYNYAASSTRGKISKQINENFPNIFWTATEENNKVGEILKELIPDVWLGKRDLWRLDLSAFKKVLEAEDDNNIMIKEEGGIKVEESEQIATDWNSIVSRNNGRPSIPILSNLINNGREGGICALRASVFLTHKLVGMALYNCDAYSGNSGKYVWMDRLIIENNLTGKLNGEETVIAILAKMVAVAKEMKAECIEWTDDSNELANYGKLLHSLGAVNMNEINGEHLYRWDVNKYYLLKEPLTFNEEKKKEIKEFVPKYY
uniref:Transglutaminase-like domain-containing protein n=1 Tax=Meloidogyne hapla TaxID=6305 RepID=A0A1I8BJ17_MELHA